MTKKRSMPIFSLKNQNLSFYVYNGKFFLPVKFYESNLKYKVGEFVFTKKKCVRVSKIKKKK
jgi:ribosomal protein S19